VKGATFSDVITGSLYFDAFCFPWSLQKTCFGYMEAVDQLTGSSLKTNFLNEFDEDNDGIVTFEEFGRKGLHGILVHLGGSFVSKMAMEELGYLKGRFSMYSKMLKFANSEMNQYGYDFFSGRNYGAVCLTAFMMSMMEESPDLFIPGLLWGNEKWPSFQLAQFAYTGSIVYGQGFPNSMGLTSLYSQALFYADLKQNGGEYAGELINQPDPQSVSRYVSDVKNGVINPLDFVLFVPPGLDNIGGAVVPNVEVTTDPVRVFTANFSDGQETWPEGII